MHLKRLLQINMATLAALGALLLGMGQRSVGPPLLVAFAAVLSIWLTDITGWFRIGQRTANLLMLAGGAIASWQAFPLQGELQALEFAWFLIFLQIIILFQAKDHAKYRFLGMLSLLQVVVATLFNQGVWFGVLLAVYMALGFSSLVLMLFSRESEAERTGGLAPQDKGHAFRAALARFFDMPWRTIALEPVHSAANADRTLSGTTGPTRWPLASLEPTFVCLPSAEARWGVGRDLYGRLGRMILHSLVLAIVLFFALPRFGETTWRGAVANPQPLVGYSDSVALGELGQIIEDGNEVMRVRFYDPATGDHQPILGEIYLQGAVLMTYDHGRWHTGLPSWNMRTELLEPEDSMPKTDFIQQKITIQALDHDELFFVAPWVALDSTIELSFNHAQQRLLRFEQIRNRQFTYKLGTTAIVGGVQKPLTPRDRLDDTRERALQFPEASLPNLKKLAQQWIDESGLPEQDRFGRARYLEQKLAASGLFRYSLTGQDRDPAIDPIEDFVTQHREGHCEYFATALTLMLRSQGIPARLIVGYKCDEWNPTGQCYTVRQLHAHTWVEAYLKPAQIPLNLLHGKDYWSWWRRGGWLRLDATPGGAERPKASTWLAPARSAMDWLDWGWSNYVMDLDYQRQWDAIYGPIGRAAAAVFDAVTDPESWFAGFCSLAALLYLDQLTGAAAWFAYTLLGLLFVAILAFVGRFLWRRGRRLWARWKGIHARTRRRSEIEFYRRFEAVLARLGIQRKASQTQREFAEVAGLRLAQLGGDPRLMATPSVVVDAFYRVRFGRQPLDNLESQAVEQVLMDLTSIAGKIR